ncbi:uncharacterized protein LOC113217541 isoform X1 [Frankliniella occidentalis]|uniref:Gustatory receptor n=1 Tax=Frankliniella occidentalis TaxID=133901 RepID=A0A9C6UAC1_FRAOC|nr:uncharacterized protein LOC113217541 isoform X1 [Frankliniella occidentalis]
MSIVHVLSHVVVLVIWFEVPRAVKCRVHLVDFAENYIEMVGEQPYSKGTRFVRWYTLAFCFVLAPFLVVIWCNYILRKPFLTHGPSHLLQLVNVISSVVVFDIACMIVRDLASNVAAKLKEELDSDRMTASRLEEFRLAWLNLRQLTVDLGSMSLTGLSMVFYLLVIVTLTSYQSAVSYYNNNILLCFASTGVLLVAQFALIHICDTAHRLKDVMFTGFYEPLASKSWRVLPADLLTEHQQFLHTISTNPAEVTFMGMISIKRPTYLSIMAAIATYLIVLFQLRMSDEDLPTKATTNSTESSLDSLFGSKTSN